MLRVARICSRPEDRDKRLEELKSMLLSRGYRKGMLEVMVAWVKRLDRKILLGKVVRVNVGEDRVRYITTYDPRLPSIPALLAQPWETMVQRDPRLRPAFLKPPQACYRRGQNLSDHLIRARLPQPEVGWTRAAMRSRVVGMRSCGRGGRRQGCRLCPHLGAAADPRGVVKEVVINHSKEVITIKEDLDCTTESCLYLLNCVKLGCGKQYIGETGRKLYERYKEHEDSAQDRGTTLNVGKPFQLPGHSRDDMEMVGLERVRGGLAVRKVREKALIRKYQMERYGLNGQA